MTQAIKPSFNVFSDIDGQPLENGHIYVGTAGLAAATNQIQVYWDSALTIPATQPISTTAGYPMRSGSPSMFFVDADDYSLQVSDRNNSSIYSALNKKEVETSSSITFENSGTGAVSRTVSDKLADVVSVKDFGAIGDDLADDTAAFVAALATGKDVFVPEGIYKVTSKLSISGQQKLYGSSRGNTFIKSSASDVAIYMGGPGDVSLIYDCQLMDLTIQCSSRESALKGVELENCVYFNVARVTVLGSGSPNSAVPADQVLYGSGIFLSNNTIIGNVYNCSARLWREGYYFKTLTASQSYWTAAISVSGQGEVANCMRGMVIGDPTINKYSGVNLTIRDISFQGCYTTAINLNSGDNTVIDGCYFEGNGNYDIAVGSFGTGSPAPIGCKIINCSMSSENIGANPYAAAPYLAKVFIDDGTFTTIRDNNLSISTAIPLIDIARGTEAKITGNRLNSAIAVASRISDAGTSTMTSENSPEKPLVAVGTITRALDGATADVSYTGLGFKPNSIEFVAVVSTTNEYSEGFSGVTGGGIIDRCLTTDGAGAKTSSNTAIKIIRSTAADIQSAVVKSFDADGFTLTWTLTGAPPANTMTINYIAWR